MDQEPPRPDGSSDQLRFAIKQVDRKFITIRSNEIHEINNITIHEDHIEFIRVIRDQFDQYEERESTTLPRWMVKRVTDDYE